MNDFQVARQKAYDRLAKGNWVKRLSEDEKKSLDFLQRKNIALYDILLVNTEYIKDGVGQDINFYLVLKPDFPLTLPKVYVAEESYEQIKYIPHIDVNRLLCTFDSETTRPNPADPGAVVQLCLTKAINIIEAGVAGTNAADFEDEFKAYWENDYDGELPVKRHILALLGDANDVSELHVIDLVTPVGNYNQVIYRDNEIGRRFLAYLKYRNISFKEQSICDLGLVNIPFEPPLILNNEKIEAIVKNLSVKQQSVFRKYLNKHSPESFIFGHILVKGQPLYLGWIHGKFDLKRKGFRKEMLTDYFIFKTFQKKDVVNRVSPQIYTPKQASQRTDGISSSIKFNYKFLIAGLGSIGSNFMYFLNSINSPEFRLIDYQELTIDNVNRHFLGMDYLSISKVEGLKLQYALGNPFQIISVKQTSILQVCQEEIAYINESDFIFCAIGKANIDQWIGHALRDGIITKPIFFLWVEPHLAGGHCLYLSPGGKNYDDFFNDQNFFMYNIIDVDEYKAGNNHLSMREIGCQVSYTPYSLNNVVSFLSTIFPKVNEMIKTPPPKSMSLTWKGDIQILADLGIKISQFASDHISETLIISE